MTDQEALAALLRERSLTFGSFRLASGQQSRYYIDARKTTMSAAGQALIGPLGLRTIRGAGWAPAAVGGLTLGADPISYAIARASADSPPEIQAFSVRKAAKSHGTGRRIEGNLAPGDRVVVIEDVVTSGGSALEAIEAVRKEGGEVLGVLALVSREESGVRAIEEQARCRVVVITTTKDLGIP
ncbi:MAG TPA: orotate phosphoribosyltransferase [Gemmatimonadales bacterium]|nr:orotate phosphoribosyltransferase [Gemmatimonadales bacterium]